MIAMSMSFSMSSCNMIMIVVTDTDTDTDTVTDTEPGLVRKVRYITCTIPKYLRYCEYLKYYRTFMDPELRSFSAATMSVRCSCLRRGLLLLWFVLKGTVQ